MGNYYKDLEERTWKKKFASLKDYATDFLDFLEENETTFSEDSQKIYLEQTIQSYLDYLKQSIREEIESALRDKDEIYEREIKKIISNVIKKQYKIWTNAENSPNMPEDFHKQIIKKYENEINKAINRTLEKLPITKNDKEKIIEIIGCLFQNSPQVLKTLEFLVL